MRFALCVLELWLSASGQEKLLGSLVECRKALRSARRGERVRSAAVARGIADLHQSATVQAQTGKGSNLVRSRVHVRLSVI